MHQQPRGRGDGERLDGVEDGGAGAQAVPARQRARRPLVTRACGGTIESWGPTTPMALEVWAGANRCTTFGTLRRGDRLRREPILRVAFYASEGGREPVCDWLRGLDRYDRQTIDADLKTAQFGWPMGMPTLMSEPRGIHGSCAPRSAEFESAARLTHLPQDRERRALPRRARRVADGRRPAW